MAAGTRSVDPIQTRAKVVGLIPAAGHATRLAPLPFSKELYPIGWNRNEGGAERPKVACQYLLDKMRLADIKKAYIVIREGKWDIPAYLRDGSAVDIDLAYVVVTPTAGPPYTLDAAYPFVRDAIVAFGFPDILFEGDDAFRELLARQANGNADLILGLFPASRPETMDMVEIDEDGKVINLVIQPKETRLQYSWDVAVWTPAFTDFMHNYIAKKKALSCPPELSVGHIIQAAIGHGVRAHAIIISSQPYCDIGTPAGLIEAMGRFAGRSLAEESADK